MTKPSRHVRHIRRTATRAQMEQFIRAFAETMRYHAEHGVVHGSGAFVDDMFSAAATARALIAKLDREA